MVRNRGTIGGSLCQADPSEDLAAVASALRAEMVVRSSSGTRTVPARELHDGPYETVVGPAEILTEVRVPVRPGAGSAYEKVERRVGDWAVAAAGAFVTLDGDTVADVGIGLTAVGRPALLRPERRGPAARATGDRGRPRHGGPAGRRGVQPVGRPARPGGLQAPPGRGADAPRRCAARWPAPEERDEMQATSQVTRTQFPTWGTTPGHSGRRPHTSTPGPSGRERKARHVPTWGTTPGHSGRRPHTSTKARAAESGEHVTCR